MISVTDKEDDRCGPLRAECKEQVIMTLKLPVERN